MARKKPEVRKAEILESALTVANRDGWINMTRDSVAEHAGVAIGLVNHYYGTMSQLKRAVMRAAITRGEYKILAQGVLAQDPVAIKAPGKMKKEAVSSYVG